MDDAVYNALKRRRELKSEIEKIDAFLAAYESFSGTKIVRDELLIPESPSRKSAPNVGEQPEKRRRGQNNPAELARIAAAVIREVGRPVPRGELVELMEAKGVTIVSEDKPRYIGTILWRRSDMFENIEGEGYSLIPNRSEEDLVDMIRD